MKKRDIGQTMCIILLCMLVFYALPIVVNAETVRESAVAGHGVSISPNGDGWTMDAGEKAVESLPRGTTISTGIESNITEMEEWQHLYHYIRRGEIPVGQWKVIMSHGYCIHELGKERYENLIKTYYLGLSLKSTESICHSAYMPGWTALCADCKEPILTTGEGEFQKAFYLYGSRESVSFLTSLDVSLDYYYLCPFCVHIEQGAGKRYHDCKKVSTNRYRVVYLLSEQDRIAGAGGNMNPSIHMYNNDTAYEGRRVIPQTTLNPNTYTYPGHVVKEWVWTTLNEDGTYTMDHSKVFAPETEIWNLTTENWKDETSGGGTVYLTAVWEDACSTLEIDANGGKYQGKSGVTTITQAYATEYTVDMSALTAPVGYKVKFVLNGGKLSNGITSMTADKSFVGFSKGSNFQGIWNSISSTYAFETPNAHTDTLIANWSPGSIVLPTPVKEGFGFGGWYAGAAGDHYIGTGGDAYTPTKDITLYAKWVDLTLVGTDNYTDNGGKGAVDLRWFWGDASQGSNKVYLVFQRKAGGDWVQINSVDKAAESVSLSHKFSYDGVVNKKFVVPYSGVYTLTAAGAQGATTSGCAGKTGGKGGEVTAKVWLNEGDVLTYTCGGQGGFHGGGSATHYGSGGGYTSISSAEKGLLMIAGGGGGATPGRDGGVGGFEAINLGNSYAGLNGTAGGGGGAVAGAAGNYEKHEHDEECLQIENKDYSLFESGWWNDYQSYVKLPSLWYGRNDNYKEGTVTSDITNVHSEILTYTGLNGHTREGISTLSLELGAAYGSGKNKVYPAFSDSYIPVMDNTSLSFDLSFNAWGDMIYYQHCTKEVNRMRIYNQDNEVIYDKHLRDYEHKVEEVTQYNYTDVTYYIRDTIAIPEGTTSVFFSCYVEDFPNTNRWLTLRANSITFNGGIAENVICGYESGQILSNSASGGGGSWVNKEVALSYTVTPGNNAGNGYVSVTSELVGFVEDLSMKAIAAPDAARPDSVNVDDIKVREKGPETVELSWPVVEELADNMTMYEHKVVAYNKGSATDATSVTGNVVVNYLGGIKGFYVKVDNRSNTILTDGVLTTNNRIEVHMTRQRQYLHIAAVDIGRNVSDTTHINLGSLEDAGELPIYWPLTTEQLQISAETGLYRKDNKTYYVKADGSTPFILHYQAGMAGPAREDYQINHGILKLTSNSLTGRDVTTVRNSAMLSVVQIPEMAIASLTTGSGLLTANQYISAGRSKYNTVLNIDKRFVLQPSMDACVIRVTPGAGAVTQEGTVYSTEALDEANDLYLIGDATAPVISGLEELRHGGIAAFDAEGLCKYVLTALDAGSGMDEFYAVVTNKDNGLSKTVNSSDSTTLILEFMQEEEILSGEVEITLYAVDRVGNVNTQSVDVAAFALQVTAERILAPHEPVFKAGESGILRIHTYGYVSRIEVEYPSEWSSYLEETVYSYDYTGTGMHFREEILQFMVPIELEEEAEYRFVVKAFKGAHTLQAEPEIATIYVEGSVLDGLRTRLR